MNYYETTFICASNLGPDKVTELVDKITSCIKQNNGEIISVNEWGKRRMAYPINNFNEGIYVHIEFKAEIGDFISKIEHIYRLTESIIRYLTIKVKKKKIEPIQPAKVKKDTKEETPIPENNTLTSDLSEEREKSEKGK